MQKCADMPVHAISLPKPPLRPATHALFGTRSAPTKGGALSGRG